MKTKITGFLTISLISVTVLANDITNEKIPVVSGLNMKIGAYASFESGFSKENHLKKSLLTFLLVVGTSMILAP